MADKTLLNLDPVHLSRPSPELSNIKHTELQTHKLAKLVPILALAGALLGKLFLCFLFIPG